MGTPVLYTTAILIAIPARFAGDSGQNGILSNENRLYRLFQRRPQLALELLGLNYRGDDYHFGSEEIKQTAFRIDGIFKPIAGEPEQPIIFAEVQYQPDADFYGRFISEIALYLRLHKPGRRWLEWVRMTWILLKPFWCTNYQT